MDCAAPTRATRQAAPSCGLPKTAVPSVEAALPPFVLPLLTRSASLLALVLQDGAVDLELASSVVAIDPGLAFGTLQLANRDGESGADPVWQIPLAVVSAGREAMLQLIGRSARVESDFHARRADHLHQLFANAVARAAVAHFLARELGSGNPRKSYLAGLLRDLPALVKTTFASQTISQAELLTTMCRSLPAAAVTAAVASPEAAGDAVAADPVVAIVRIADSVLTAGNGGAADTSALEPLISGPLWRSWQAFDLGQRSCLLDRGCKVAKWSFAHVYKIDPWEFIARLESPRTWE
jgi:HDOD domain